jgi:hypothetical protein
VVDHLTDIDQVIGDHPEADPALHSVVAAVSAAVETMAAFADADMSLSRQSDGFSAFSDRRF